MKKVAVKYTDSELINALKQTHVSNAAISFIYKNYYGLLSNYTRQNQGSEQDAEDIFQEVVVGFISSVKQDKFRGESSVKTFLYTLNRFTWLNELKKRGRALLREEKYGMDEEWETTDVSHLLAGREERSMILNTMEKLDEICRKILVAYYYDSLPMKEILPLVSYENEQVLRNKKYKCLKSLEQMLTADPALAARFKNALTYGQ
ncbi:MAG: RNA polymerase sigma factor [Sphingobacteriaceae bacterium]|nr:MAG: RNA polymerase sigma factor [Sphingobacteriaceae bacterium]